MFEPIIAGTVVVGSGNGVEVGWTVETGPGSPYPPKKANPAITSAAAVVGNNPGQPERSLSPGGTLPSAITEPEAL
jgi:hypothetical protein